MLRRQIPSIHRTAEGGSKSTPYPDYAVYDLQSELPATAVDGNLAFTIDTGKVWKRTGGAWAELGVSGPGGADPWTYRILTQDATTSATAASDVVGLSFTPAPSTIYEIEGRLLLRTATATANPRAGWAWPTGADGTMEIRQAQSANAAPLFAYGNPNAALLIAAGGLPNTTQSWPATYGGILVVGSSPSGNARVQLASETAGVVVTVKAGSFLRYRTVP